MGGIRRKIRVAKNQKLDWCKRTLRIARDEFKSGAGEQRSIAEIMAYRSMSSNDRKWQLAVIQQWRRVDPSLPEN